MLSKGAASSWTMSDSFRVVVTKFAFSELILFSSAWLIALVACVGNLLVLVGRWLLREPRAAHSLHVASLAMADLLTGIYLLVIASQDRRFRGRYVHVEKQWRSSDACIFCGKTKNENEMISNSKVSFLGSWSRCRNLINHSMQRQCVVIPFTLIYWFDTNENFDNGILDVKIWVVENYS